MLATWEVLLDALNDDWHLQDLLGVWALLGGDLQQRLNQHSHVHRVVARDRRVLAPQHSFEESVHVISLERWLQMAHFVSYAAERPYVRFKIVRLVLPNLRAGVVRCARLRIQEALLGNLAHIQVTQFGCRILVQENVRTLHVSMQNVQFMQTFEASDDLNHCFPDILLLVVLFIVFILAYSLEDITIIGELHYYAQ